MTEGADGELECADSGELLGGKRKRGATDIELAVQTVRGNVRHRSEHALRTEERHDAFASSAHPGIIEAERSGPFGETPARPVARDFRVALGADQDARCFGGKVETFGSLPGRREDHRLLAKRLLQIVRWKTQARKFELHRFGKSALPFSNQTAAAEKRLGEVGCRASITDASAEGDDRDVAAGHRMRGRGFDALTLPLFDDEMGVVSPEAERADHSLARAFGFPGLGGLQHAKRRSVEHGVQLVDVRRRRANAMAHRSENLHQSCDTGRRDQVTHVGLQRAHGNVGEAGIHLAHRSDFGGIADRGAGGVAFDQRDLGRFNTRHLIGGSDGAHLADFGGSEHAAAAAVVGQADAADHPVNAITVADRIGKPFQGDETCTLGRKEPVRIGMKRPTLAGLAQRVQRAEAYVDEQVVGAIHGSGQHQVGVAIVELVASRLDRIERGRTRRVEGVCTRTQAERSPEEMGGQAGHEAVAWIDIRQTRTLGQLLEPYVLGIAGHRRRRKGQVTEDGSHATRVACEGGVPKCLSGRVQHPLKERIEAADFG